MGDTQGKPIEPDDFIETPLGTIARFGRHIQFMGAASPDEVEEVSEYLVDSYLPATDVERRALRDELVGILRRLDARELLMQFSVAYLHIDPNSWKEWESDNLPAHVEYLALQVLGLGGGDTDYAGTDPRDYGPALTRIDEIIKELFTIETVRVNIQTMLDSEANELSPIERQARARAIAESLVVRYNSYTKHERHLCKTLFGPIDELLLKVVGFTIADALQIYDSLGQLIYGTLWERRDQSKGEISELLKKAKQARRKPHRFAGNEEILWLSQLKPSEMKQHLHSAGAGWMFAGSRRHTRIELDALATVSGIDAVRCRAFLDLLTAPPESFDEAHHLFPCPTHPLQDRPLIADGDAWLCPIPGQVLMALVPCIESALQNDTGDWEPYSSWRGTYLEDETAKSISEALPGSRVWKRVNWSSATSAGELDVVVSYDDVTFVVQCKAGRVTPPARRGAIHRMRTDLAKLVGEAADQHRSFRESLEASTAKELGIGFLEAALDAPLVLDVAVTLDDLSSFTAEAYKLIELGTLSGAADVPWTTSLADLFVVTEMLHGCELIHYVTRRVRLNRLGRTFAHDELDWLGHYLQEGLFFDYTFSDEHAPDYIGLMSYTEVFDSWYLFESGTRTVATPKPERERAPRVAGLLRRLEAERPRHFSLAGLVACDWALDHEYEVHHQVELARARASENGRASITLVFPAYGFSWGFSVEYVPGDKLATFLATKTRSGDEAKDLWIAVVERPALPLSVSVSLSGAALRSEVDNACLEAVLDFGPPVSVEIRSLRA